MRRTTKAAIGALAALMGIGALGPPAQAAETSPPFVPPPRLSVGDVTLVEGDAAARGALVPLTLSRPVLQDIVVTWRTAPIWTGAEATPGVDFRAVTAKRVKIRAGQVGALLPVRVFDDTIVDSSIEALAVEIVGVEVPGFGPVPLPVERTGSVSIFDDESYTAIVGVPEPEGPWVSIGQASAVEGDAGKRVVAVPIVLSQPQKADVFVTWQTGPQAGAVPGEDFKPVSKTTRIPAGRRHAFARVTVYGDTTPEVPESIILEVKNLTGGDGVVLLPGNGGLRLFDDDTDTDGDLLVDVAEEFYGTDAGYRDTDDDGIADGLEVYQSRTDPLSNDTDGDGLDDRFEIEETSTDPRLFDTDGDGFDDLIEIKSGSNPLDPASIPPPEPVEP
jgi:hypothetical protein